MFSFWFTSFTTLSAWGTGSLAWIRKSVKLYSTLTKADTL